MFDIKASNIGLVMTSFYSNTMRKYADNCWRVVALIPGEHVRVVSPRKGFLQFVKLEGCEGCSVSPLFPPLSVVYLVVLASLSLLLLRLLILDFDAGVVILNININLFIIFFRGKVSLDDVMIIKCRAGDRHC